MEEFNVDDLLEKIRRTDKKVLKWVCPICCGGDLSRQKVLYNTLDDDAEVEVNTALGELMVHVDSEEGEILSKFPIRYCPWCGRKIREKLKKSTKKLEKEKK